MLRSSALFVAILVSLLIGVLCFCLVLVSHVNRVQVQQDKLVRRLYLNLKSGVNLLLSKSDFVAFDEEKTIDLFGEERDSIYLNRKHWGIYDIGIVKARKADIARSKVFLYGCPVDEKSRYAIWLTDQNRPLSVSGATSITGDCYLPKAGIQSAFVNSVGYSGIKYVEGKTLKSEETLPEYNKVVIDRILHWSQNPVKVAQSEKVEVTSSIGSDTTINRSFFEPTLLIHSKGTIVLQNTSIEGNVIVSSETSIIIHESAILSHIQLYAPCIKIKEKFTGSIQAYVTDSLSTGQFCKFTYPSVFGLMKEGNLGKTLYVKIGEKNEFNGIVFTNSKVKDIEQTKVSVGKESIIHGQVFCNGYVEMKPDVKVYGSITCNRFLVENGVLYSNYIFNTTIDFSKLSPDYVSSELFKTSKNRKIISWQQ